MVAPVSCTALLVIFAVPIFDFGWFLIETMAKIQLWARLIIPPIILATKAYEALKRFV